MTFPHFSPPLFSIDCCLILFPCVAPSAPPMNVAAATITSTSFLLQWAIPTFSGRNGNIRSYILVVTELSSSQRMEISTQNNNQQFDSLHPYFNYSFSVAAVTVSVGVFSEPQIVTTLEDRKLISYGKVLCM